MYFGTPVVLISTMNEDDSVNLAPISSAWWLGHSCMIGMGQSSKTVENLLRDRECVLNLPSSDMVAEVDKLALTTGSNPVPDYKKKMNFKYVKNKFDIANLTPVSSNLVRPSRVKECPVHLEAKAEIIHKFEDKHAFAIEVNILRMHIDEILLNDEKRHYVDTDKWKPLIMSFCEFYGLGEKVHPSKLAKVF
jgi:flavin reductase (DIM6/NTAB) family NADH-FMN oxidoreductase RutF